MNADGSQVPGREPDRRRSWFTHPFLLALIPAIATVVVASSRSARVEAGRHRPRRNRTTRDCQCRYVFECDLLTASGRQTREVRDEADELFAITGRASSYGERWLHGSLACNQAGLFPERPSGGVDCASPVSGT